MLGGHRDHVIAFARRYQRKRVIVAVGRMLGKFTDDGRTWLQTKDLDAAIDISRVSDLKSQEHLPVAGIIKNLPAGIMVL